MTIIIRRNNMHVCASSITMHVGICSITAPTATLAVLISLYIIMRMIMLIMFVA